MDSKFTRTDLGWGVALVFYLLLTGIGATVLAVDNFPQISQTNGGRLEFPNTQPDGRVDFWPFGGLLPEQGLLLLAFMAGMTGSFLHASQSLAGYIGNKTFRASWTVWYALRPWIGGVLGVVIYFVARAGLMGGGANTNPYGVAALGALGGWFSKTTTDKLQEVFETLFKTDADKDRTDKMASAKPTIVAVEPNPVPTAQTDIVVKGTAFQDGAVVVVAGRDAKTTFKSSNELLASIAGLPRGPGSPVRVRNPNGQQPVSDETIVDIQP